jgi:anti-sigma factor RsiW
MNDRACNIIAEMLVDFSDGELSVADRQRVESHLPGCPACRREVERLGRSLELARSVWAETAEASRSMVERPLRAPPLRQYRFRMAAILAASAAVFFVGLGTWWLAGGNREVASQEGPAPAGRRGGEPAEPTAAAPSDDAGVEEVLSRKTRAARLAATARLLATEPSLKAYQVEAERYITQAYPEDSVTRPSNRQGVVPLSKEPKS